jgi:hypothetical protein
MPRPTVEPYAPKPVTDNRAETVFICVVLWTCLGILVGGLILEAAK